jgi:two-component sensor histidine kinase
MSDDPRTTVRPGERLSSEDGFPPELAIDLAIDNALLRTALAHSEDETLRGELIAQELAHRIINLLAVVQAIARQTFNDSDVGRVADFNARLVALAAAQKALIASETKPALMADVVNGALAPHFAFHNRCALAGPDIVLDGRRAHALTLALHELATNAAKYGALSVDAGRIEVGWATESGRLKFLWRERDGPSVAVPTRKGFGSTLIARNLAAAFDGQVDLTFKATGVECRLSAPLAAGGKT